MSEDKAQPDELDPSVDGHDEPHPGPPVEVEEEDALTAAETALEQAKDQALRAMAEAENTRRRAAKDVENAHKFALERFTNELLPVLDSLEKAVESARTVADDAAAEGAQAIAEGVQLSLKLFIDTLQKFHVEQLDPLGEPFDPQFHEAIAMVENPDAEPNSIIDVVQKGYTLNGRLVRAAMVAVAKNTP